MYYFVFGPRVFFQFFLTVYDYVRLWGLILIFDFCTFWTSQCTLFISIPYIRYTYKNIIIIMPAGRVDFFIHLPAEQVINLVWPKIK